MDDPTLSRRQLLASTSVAAGTAMAGCGGLFEENSTRNPAVLEDRPDGVYVPTHVEGMEMIGMQAAGDRQVGLMYSFAHRFWTVTGSVTELVQPRGDVHLMASVWDDESGTVLPLGNGVGFTITKDGDAIAERNPWTMLSQNMGFHYGDNMFLEGDGTYEVTVSIPAVTIDRVGGFAERFGDSVTATFEWEYTQAARDSIMFRQLENAGEAGAVDPMDMMMPFAVGQPAGDLPGELSGSTTSGDITFVTSIQRREVGDRLIVSPRTRYSEFLLPLMTLSAAIERDGETVQTVDMRPAIGPTAGYHYAAPVESVSAGDELSITVESGPQTARHEGYETAFLKVPEATLTLS
jgi:hypothetical protein